MKKIKKLQQNVLYSESLRLSPGATGYREFPFEVNRKGKVDDHFVFSIDVSQPSGRGRLDVGFFVMDGPNFHRWLNNQATAAEVVVPRVVSSKLIFTPLSDGLYYALIENRFSIATSKDVSFEAVEKWWTEEEIELVKKPVERREIKRPSLIERLKSIFRSRSIALILLFIFIMFLCSIITIVMISLASAFLGIEFKDPGIYFASVVGGGVILFVMIYVHITGKPWPPITPTPFG